MKYMTKEVFDKTLPFYWVLDFKGTGYDYVPTTFKFSIKEPEHTGNPQMAWRKPTYIELNMYNTHVWNNIKDDK